MHIPVRTLHSHNLRVPSSLSFIWSGLHLALILMTLNNLRDGPRKGKDSLVILHRGEYMEWDSWSTLSFKENSIIPRVSRSMTEGDDITGYPMITLWFALRWWVRIASWTHSSSGILRCRAESGNGHRICGFFANPMDVVVSSTSNA